MKQKLALACTLVHEPALIVLDEPTTERRSGLAPRVLEAARISCAVITTNLSSMGIVREKELGRLEQLNVTPLRRWELIVGKLLPYALVRMIDVCLVLGTAILWFDVPLRGSVWLLFGLTLIDLLTTLGLGARSTKRAA
jgi:ABC-type multidrug transport system permease subunit